MLPPRVRSRALRAALLLVLLALAPTARAAPTLIYVALGDSTATGEGAAGVGYPTRLARKLELENAVTVKLLNLGVSGATASDLRRDQLPKVLGAGPQLVTIAIGINDVMKGRTLAEFSRDLQIIADTVHRSKASVVISTLPDLSLSPSGQGSPASLVKRIQQFNAAIQTVAERHGFAVADLWGASRSAQRTEGEAIWAKDGFHPSSLGYERWAEAMWPAAERALGPKVQARRAGAGSGR